MFCSAPVPPTSIGFAPRTFATMPGTSTARLAAARPEGRAAITSALITRCCVTPWTSTIGDAPETVIVSVSSPTPSSTLTPAVNEPVNSMPSRFTVLKPLNRKTTE